jgi:Fe-S cluster assembly protein SufD
MTPVSASTGLLEALTANLEPRTRLQQEALQEFVRLGLPSSKNEEYKHTPITRALEKSLNPALPLWHPGHLPEEKLWKLEGIEAWHLVFLNGKFYHEHSHLPDSLKITPLQEALPEVDAHLGQYANYQFDAFAAWNTAAWTDGLYIEIPQGCKIDKPLIFYYLHDTTAGQVLQLNRNLIVAARESQATIVEKWFTFGHAVAVSNTLSEIVLQEQATLHHLVIQTDPGNHIQYLFNQFYQASASRLNSHVITIDGTFIRNNTRVTLDGACESHLYGLYLLQQNAFADNHTVVDHRQPNAQSNELYKGVLSHQATGVFNGKIYVRPGAQKTNAFQSNRNLLLSEQAAVHTKPQLEIWADDVKCSHGCTVGQPDEDALFYLRARGIDEATAKAMLLYAFASEVTETLENQQLKTHLNDLIHNRLQHT